MFVEGVTLAEHVFSDIGVSPQRDSQHRIQFDDKMLRCDPLELDQLEVDFDSQPQAAGVCEQLAHKALDACKSFGSQLMRLIPREFTVELKTALKTALPTDASELFDHEIQRTVQHALCDQIDATESLNTIESATPCAAAESVAAAEDATPSLQSMSPATPATEGHSRARSNRLVVASALQGADPSGTHQLRLAAAPYEGRTTGGGERLRGAYPFSIWECIGIKRS